MEGEGGTGVRHRLRPGSVMEYSTVLLSVHEWLTSTALQEAVTNKYTHTHTHHKPLPRGGEGVYT